MTLTVGENVGAYRIVEQLGQGGMATVFKAYHAALDRYVAIKVMHPAFKEDTTFLARFQREARVVARLEHPNIVPVYDYAEHNGAPYLVMKFIEGETLKAKLARGPISLDEAIRIIEAVGAGLDYAHRQGILHRDIKPSNVMLAADGNIYLADFGLARIAQAGESTLSSDSLLGTPHYMSPEQAKGVKELDAGTDIYSLGVVIYELVVGRLPFSADTPFAIIHDHIYTPLPLPRQVNPNVPEGIERVLLKALAKERADRYPDVGTMAAAFREAASGVSPGLTALPHAVPVSPSIVTPTAATVKGAAPEAAGTVVAPPAPAEAKPGEKRKYQFRWWHGAVAGVLVLCCCFGLFAASAGNRQQRQTQTAAVQTQAAAVSPPVNPTPHGGGTPQPPQPSPVRATGAPPPPGGSPPPGGDVGALLAEAERAFVEKRFEDAAALLDQAVAIHPDDVGVRLAAGDMMLRNGLALPALERYYLPGVGLTQPPLDPLETQLRSHAALALYVAAANPNAEELLSEQGQHAADQPAVQLAFQRFRIFYGQGEAVLKDLETALQERPDDPGLLLVLGDYYLHAGQNPRAVRHYGAVAALALKDPQTVPVWVLLEAECNLKKIQDQKANAKLTPSCEALPKLLGPAP